MVNVIERYLLTDDIKASDLGFNMLDCLPPETLRQIFQYLNYQDIQTLEKFKQFKHVINYYKIFLAREPKKLEVFCGESSFVYQFSSIKASDIFRTKSIEDLMDMIKNYSIEILQLRKINKMTCKAEVIDELFYQMMKSRQKSITSLSLVDIEIPNDKIDYWRYIFSHILNKDCKSLTIDNVYLSRLFDHRIFNVCKKITNVKWVVKDSDIEEKKKCGDIVMANFTQHIRHSSPHKMEALNAFMEMISPKSVVMFLETWLNISCPSPFNIAIENCDDNWKEEFSSMCIASRLSNFNMQISSNKSYFSHVKMSCFNNSGTTVVNFSSIIDMPARHINQRISHGRFYRDF